MNGTSDERTPIPASGPLALLDELERGPHGILYRAHDARSGRDVCLRVPPLAWSPEASMLAAVKASVLAHPHIAPVLETGWHDGRAYVVLGEELGSAVAPGTLSPRETAAAVRDAATAVAYAAGLGLTHPGIVPSLLRFTRKGRVVLTGYELPGAPEVEDSCRAPEVRAGAAVDAAANVYSLGALLFTLLAGRRPEDLEALIVDATHADRSRRPSAAAFAAALTRWLESSAEPDGRGWNDVQLHVPLLAGTGILALLGFIGLIPEGNAAPAPDPVVRVEASAPPPEPVVAAPPAETPPPPPVVEIEAPLPRTPDVTEVEPPSSAPDSENRPDERPVKAEPPVPPVPARVGTVTRVHPLYGIFIALEDRATVGVGDALDLVREGGQVIRVKVRSLSRPEKLYPHGAAVCEAPEAPVERGQIVRRP